MNLLLCEFLNIELAFAAIKALLIEKEGISPAGVQAFESAFLVTLLVNFYLLDQFSDLLLGWPKKLSHVEE